MTTDTSNWHRDSGWPCPLHDHSFDSVEMLGIHLSKVESDDAKRREHEAKVKGGLSFQTSKCAPL